MPILYKGSLVKEDGKRVLAEMKMILHFQGEVGMRIILGSGMVIKVTHFSGFYC